MNKSLETQNHKDNQDDKKMQESGLSPEGNDYKPIVELRPLYGCAFSDLERINTLADADWLTRRLTSLYRDHIMSRLLRRFRRVSSFVITLDTKVDENTHEVKAVSFDLCGLYCGDQNIDAESKQVALSILREILHLPFLSADTPSGIRQIMQAIARDLPSLRNYFDF